MSDQEVELILREIREQVYAQNPEPNMSSAINQNGNHTPETNHDVSRLQAQMTTLARSWDRLPPVISNRRGTAARFELWVKSKARVLMRWFTWEQINFNSAVYQSFIETLEVLKELQETTVRQSLQLEQLNVRSAEEFQKMSVRSAEEFQKMSVRNAEEFQKMQRTLEAMHAKLDAMRRELELNSANSTTAAEFGSFRTAVEHELTNLATLVEEFRRQQSTDKANFSEQLAIVVNELRDGDERVAQEQRTCFKQLSLEATETALMVDRAWRKIEDSLRSATQKTGN